MSSSSGKFAAFLLGATGEVGKEIVKELARNSQMEKVTLIARRAIDLPKDDPNYDKFQQKIVDFEKLSDHSDAFNGHNVGFCVLGTTRGKAGKEGFYKVDHDYVMESAKLALGAGCKHFNLLSSQGANKNSMAFYTKVKGEVDEEVSSLSFERVSIYRPGILLCDRQESRPLESVARFFVGHLDFKRSASIPVPLLAKVMVHQSFRSTESKVEILDNKTIYNIGKSLE